MPTLSHAIIANVGVNYIETYLRKKKYVRAEEKQGQELKYWVDDLLKEEKFDVQEFEEFLFKELFWGKRKTIRVYKLDKIRDYKYPADWETPLFEKYGIDSLDYCNILYTIPDRDAPRKIAAVHYEENYKGEMTKVQLLFVRYIQVTGDNGYSDSLAYIPVEINFVKKIMIIKAWTRQQVAHEEDKAEYLMDHIKKLMALEFNVVTLNYIAEHKRVLFLMSKNLIYEAYSHIPTYNEIEKIEGDIKEFVEAILKNLPLRNVDVDSKGHYFLQTGVMDFESEIRNVIEALTISDYFFDRNFEEIWEMGLEAIVARIKFNDQEKVLTSLSGENTSTPIFCTKTFMSLKNRMQESEKIESLWITMDRKRGNLNLKFDASNIEYLEILIKYGIRFNEEDMNSALEIYEKYERRFDQQIEGKDKIAIC